MDFTKYMDQEHPELEPGEGAVSAPSGGFLDESYLEWRREVSTFEHMTPEEQDRELTRLEAEQSLYELKGMDTRKELSGKDAAATDRLLMQVQAFRRFREAGVLADFPDDMVAQGFDVMGDRLARSHENVHPMELKLQSRASGLGEGELHQRLARDYAGQLRTGMFDKLEAELDDVIDHMADRDYVRTYEKGLANGYLSDSDRVRMNAGIRADFMEAMAAANDVREYQEAMDASGWDFSIPEPDIGTEEPPAYTQGQMGSGYASMSADEVMCGFYEKVMTCDAILDDRTRQILGEGYESYKKESSEVSPVAPGKVFFDEFHSVFDFSRDLHPDCMLGKQPAKEHEAVPEKKETEKEPMERRLPDVPDLEPQWPEKDDGFSFDE